MKQNNFLLFLLLLASIIYIIYYPRHSIFPDESKYLLLGKEITDGEYSEDFFHRMPLIPLSEAFFYILGLNVDAIKFLIPLIFIYLAILTTYLLAKEICDKNVAQISAIILVVFPFFWRWGTKVLADIPLLVITNSLLYFFIRIRENNRFFLHFGIVMGLGSITKLSFFILPLLLYSYIFMRRRDLLKAREFWIGSGFAILIFLFSYMFIHFITVEIETSQFNKIGEHLIDPKQNVIFQIITGRFSSAKYLAKLILFPLIIFTPFGIFALYKKGEKLLIFYFFLFIALFFLIWHIRIRTFSPLYSLFSLFVAQGYFELKKKHFIKILFIILAVISFLDAIFLLNLDSESRWGADILAKEITHLDGNIASEYLPDYLKAKTSKEVIPFKIYYEVDGERIPREEVQSGFKNASHPRHEEFRRIYNNPEYKRYPYLEDEWVRENGVDYIVLSIYEEWEREPTGDHFHPKLGPFEIKFVKRPYSNGRVPPDYDFRSELYYRLEDSEKYEKIGEVYRGSQRIFIIYEVTSR